MALPLSGPISSSQIATELVVSSTNFSANSAELLVYTDLNTLSISSSGNILNIDTPVSMSEWYKYNHNFKVSGSVVTSSIGLNAPFTNSYSYTTFAQIEMGTTSSIFNFTGSNFVSSGLATFPYVPYSIYYSTYSLAMSSSKQCLQAGFINPSGSSFNYSYIPSSGSIITLLFKEPPPPPTASFTTDAYLKYDQFSSSISSSGVWNNLGTGGSAYNLKVFNATSAVSSSGTGTGSYVSFNTGTVVNQYATASGINIGNKSYTVHIVLRARNWFKASLLPGPLYTPGTVFSILDSNNTGFLLETSGYPNSTSDPGKFSFFAVSSGSGMEVYEKSPVVFDGKTSFYTGISSFTLLNQWIHYIYTYDSQYQDSVLDRTNRTINYNYWPYPSIPPPESMTGTPLKIYVGMQSGVYFPAGVDIAYLAVWTGSSVPNYRTLNDEYSSRFPSIL